MRYFFILAFLVCGTFHRTGSADQVRWQFREGDCFEIKLSQKSVLTSNVNRTEVRVELELGSEMAWEIVSVKPNGNAVIKQSFTRMNVKVAKTAKPTIRYDTASEDEPAGSARYFAEIYDQLVGIHFEVEMTDRGEVVGVVLNKKDAETLRRIPESMQARQLFEKRGLQELLNGGGFVLPSRELNAGDQWPLQKKQKLSFGTAQLNSVFTYEGTDREKGVAVFEVKSNVQLEDDKEDPLEKPLTIKSQQQTGTYRFDVGDGYLRSVETTQQMVTEKPYREMKIETDSMVENRLTLVKKRS